MQTKRYRIATTNTINVAAARVKTAATITTASVSHQFLFIAHGDDFALNRGVSQLKGQRGLFNAFFTIDINWTKYPPASEHTKSANFSTSPLVKRQQILQVLVANMSRLGLQDFYAVKLLTVAPAPSLKRNVDFEMIFYTSANLTFATVLPDVPKEFAHLVDSPKVYQAYEIELLVHKRFSAMTKAELKDDLFAVAAAFMNCTVESRYRAQPYAIVTKSTYLQLATYFELSIFLVHYELATGGYYCKDDGSVIPFLGELAE
ncbi:hypothetical protein HMPREF1544_02086 [Mucor circinelloides 1006PhL]|uniref:Uncharacterized protein n=1 Tax=Mucor circinelloides f. circinelloides (strain 1006PhL) TaxID=1220926 RepID=S2JR78_MUCC1|nr:hypothetical protein HMPREF1544_02086 [Mucor circinelloides 1006PhL]